jgi:hypothetical protein
VVCDEKKKEESRQKEGKKKGVTMKQEVISLCVRLRG